MIQFLSVCVAGGLGSGARLLISVWTAERLGPTFPYGTLAVNLSGCFLISLLMPLAASQSWSPLLRATVAVGFLGGFTTYSSFNFETIALMQRAPAQAAGYLLATVLGGLAASWLGLMVTRQLG